MDEFYYRFIKGDAIDAPEHLVRALQDRFEKPVNIEWYFHNGYYEAVFYIDKLEHLVRFQPDGALVEYKVNLPEKALPPRIKKIALSKGEIMNVMAIRSGKIERYEVIYRDKALQRFLLLVKEDGGIVSDHPL